MIKMSLIYHREDHKILHFKNAEPARESTLLFLCRSAATMQRRTSVRRSWWTDGQLPYRPRGEQPDGKGRLFSQRDEQQGGKWVFLRLERHLACTVLSRSTLLCRIENRKSSKLTKTSPELRVCSVLSHCTPLVEEILPPPFPDWLLRWQMRMWWWL